MLLLLLLPLPPVVPHPLASTPMTHIALYPVLSLHPPPLSSVTRLNPNSESNRDFEILDFAIGGVSSGFSTAKETYLTHRGALVLVLTIVTRQDR